MTNYERILKRVAEKDVLAKHLQEICNDTDDCEWCPANEDGYCAMGDFRKWLDEPEHVEFPKPDFIYKEL